MSFLFNRSGLPLFFCVLLGGCSSEGFHLGNSSQGRQGFQARGIAIQPSFTRFVETGDKGGEIDAYVGVEDSFGDPMKVLGLFRFELFTFRPGRADPRGKRFEAGGIQEFDLSEVASSQGHWDPILRLYRFKVPLSEWPGDSEKMVLQVTFTDGQLRLVDTQIVSRRGN